MYRITRAAAPLLILAVIASCGERAEQSEAASANATVASPAPVPPSASMPGVAGKLSAVAVDRVSAPASPGSAPDQLKTDAAQTNATPSMVIRNGSAQVLVDSLEMAIAAVQKMATSLGGFVGNTTLQAGAYQVRSATLELKIPSAKFDAALAGLAPIGKVESVSSTAEDVGEEYVDVNARMSNAKRLEDRLVTLLATRTGKLEDVLAVERELARVREEIERYEGRIRFLKTRVATSTLSITVHERAPIVSAAPGENIMFDAFKSAWRNFVRFIAGLISSLGVLVPMALLLLLGFRLWKRFAPRVPK